MNQSRSLLKAYKNSQYWYREYNQTKKKTIINIGQESQVPYLLSNTII